MLDQFLHLKFRQLKRYSLEGTESLLPALWAAFDEAALHGLEDVVVGMAHRGRTNLLLGMMQYPPSTFFGKVPDQRNRVRQRKCISQSGFL